MPEDENQYPPDYKPDDDVPFKLPNADQYDRQQQQGEEPDDPSSEPTLTNAQPVEDESSIHKADTEDIIITDEMRAVDIHDQMTEDVDIEALHAQDPPLSEDASAVETAPHHAVRPDDVARRKDDDINPDDYLDDNDVPFKLPRDDGAYSDGGKVGNKWVTMPSNRSSEPTLPGTGGLDPNPDMKQGGAEMTVPHMPAVQPMVPGAAPRQTSPDHQQFQRPRAQAQPPRPYAQTVPPPTPSQSGVMQRPLPRRRRRFNPGCMAIFVGVFLTFCGGLTLVSLGAGAFAYARVGDLLNERIDLLDDYDNFESTFLFDRNGVQLYEVFDEGRRTNVNLDDMPDVLIEATISIEDDSFYRNIGIDIPATTVALMGYLGAGPDGDTPGGSSITQQLVRNVLFDFEYAAERSAQRKAEEILLAIALTQRLSKDEVLEMYLNEIYYGNLAYGAQAAAQIFFGKDVGQLTLGEAALLAGLPQSPAELDPLNPDPVIQASVLERWRQVLGEMVEEGYITAAQRDAALREGLTFNPQDIPLRAPHFTVHAREQLEELMTGLGYSPEQIALGGLRVYTSVDVRINDAVQQIAAAQVAAIPANRNVGNAAVVVLKPVTGEILAMVGSIDYNNDFIDGRFNVTTGLRQPGSTMKPFTYAAAIEQGFTPGDVLWDTRTRIGIPGQPTYEPVNYDGSVHGPMRIRTALANSYNIPAVQMLRQVGVQYLLDVMGRFGVASLGQDASVYGLSLTLGGGEVSPLELTEAYAVFANAGVLVENQAILCVLDNDDNIIFQYENGCPEGNRTADTVVETGLGTQVLDPRIAYIISDILADNGARTPAMGGNSPLFTPNIATSVKTGTTDDVKDNWTMGYTRNVAVGVWVGNNNGDPMFRTSGLTGAAPIWNEVMSTIYAESNRDWLAEFALDGQLRPDQLQPPPGVSLRQICDIRRLQDPAQNCPATVNEWFLDSPAGLPDADGNLIYPPNSPRQPEIIPQRGSYVQILEPGVMRSAVFRLDPGLASAIQFPVAAGERQPPPPLYCRVPLELVSSTPGVTEQLFIPPPPVQADAVEAEEYARARGLAFLPTIECTPELLQGGGQVAPGVLAVIQSPAPGSTITDATPIIGTAQFSPGQANFYKLEIIGGQFGNWTTIGQTHANSVINGQLEILPGPPGLQPGQYRLRLALIGTDGNALVTSPETPFIVP